MTEFSVRGREIGDVEYVMSSWINHAQQKTGFGKSVRKSVFMKEHHKLMKSVLNDAKLYVCYDPAERSHILGYAVVEHLSHIDVIHFMMVKESMRGKGIGQALIDVFKKRNMCEVTHKTAKKDEVTIFDKNYMEVEYNPYRFLNGNFRHD